MRDRHLISVDELRALGALDVPPEWRKSLSAGTERSGGLFRDEHFLPEGATETTDLSANVATLDEESDGETS